MQIKLLMIGKTDQSFIKDGMQEYISRVKKYLRFEVEIIPDIKSKNLSQKIQKQKEGELILKKIASSDYVILLDEKGKKMRSVEFARFLQNKLNHIRNNVVFIIGGPYGFSPDIYARCQEKISLSNLTFSHQLVRLVFLEQLYRANTIIKGEPYHHE